MQDDSLDQLIRDAYALVARPERLLNLLTVLQKPGADNESALQPHFANVTELLAEIDPSVGDDFQSYDLDGEAGGKPAEPDLSFDCSLRIGHFDRDLFGNGALTPDQKIPDWLLGGDRDARSQLEAMAKAGSKAKPVLLRFHVNPEDPDGMLFAIQPSDGTDPRFDCRVMRLRWDERSGTIFAQSLALTKTEEQLARHLVNGGSVNEFALTRGRSVGTARNQLKALLRKLAIGSQTDLIALYAGFHSAFMTAQIGKEGTDTGDTGHQLDLGDGHILPYETYGDPDGLPVLYLHATIDGAYLTARQQQAAAENGLRVIAPWLPFYAGSKMTSHGLAAVDEFVDRLVVLLDRLKLDRCPVITARVAAPYGFAALQRDPKRFCGLVMAGAILPADDDNDFSHLALGYRAPLRLARIAPSFVRLYFAATATMVRRGKGMEYFESIYGDSPADLATLRRPDVIALMQRSMQRTFEDGYESTAQQAVLTASDWSHWCHGTNAPVTVISGAEDGLAPPAMVTAFCQRHGFTLIGPLDGVGSLAIQQVPHRIFAEARTMAEL